jgi:hypothetical protein
LNVTDPPNTAGPGVLAGCKALDPLARHGPSYWVLVEKEPKMLGPPARHGPSYWVLVEKEPKMLGPSGDMVKLGVGS